MSTYLYIHPGLRSVSHFQDSTLHGMTERHHFRLPVLSLKETSSLQEKSTQLTQPALSSASRRDSRTGANFELAGRALRRGSAVYFYWPTENAVEVVDSERLSSFWRHWAAYVAANRLQAINDRVRSARNRLQQREKQCHQRGQGLFAGRKEPFAATWCAPLDL